jgi:glycosyltransferase involved in cell wall biosynthesis
MQPAHRSHEAMTNGDGKSILDRPLVIVTSSFPIRHDGSEAAGSFVADFVDALARHVLVRVVAPGPATAIEPWSDRVDVYRYIAPSQPLSTLKPWYPAHLFWILRVLRSGAAATRSAIADDAGHVFALWGLPCGEWARRASIQARIGYSVWLLGSDVWSLGRVPLLRSMLARVIRDADRVYADGYQLADDAKRLSGREPAFLPSTRDIVDDPASTRRASPPFRLLFLGRWHRNKGVDLLLDALAMLTDSDWMRIERIDIEGGGPLDEFVRTRARALRARGRPVDVGGFLDKRAAATAISACDWLLIPSRIESIPVVFSDAMKLHRPVVATPVGDLPRLLHDRACGIVCDRADATSFAEGLRTALQGGRIDENDFREIAELFSLESIAARLLSDHAH